jgi:hypothetical protein
MKTNVKFALAALVIALASCTSKPADNAAETADPAETETPAPVESAPESDTTAAPVDSAAVQ